MSKQNKSKISEVLDVLKKGYGEDNNQTDEEEVVYNEPAPILKMRNFLESNYTFQLNTITFNMEYRQKGKPKAEVFDDKNKSDLMIELKSIGFKRPKEDLDNLLTSSMTIDHNPITDYFEGLKYNGKGFIQKLTDMLILDDLPINIENKTYKELLDYYFRKWLYSCYQCFTGVQKNDVMFILIGAQGRFKTSFLNFLTPPKISEYSYTGHINPQLSDYNTATYLTEKIFINVDDQMENIFGKDYNSMKSIISQDFLPLRKLYKVSHKRRQRIANFCGSVNEPRFLRDSNNRRYLCFMIRDILPAYIDIDIDSLWAEVREELKLLKNSLYLFDKNDFANIDEMNSLFHTPSTEEEILNTLFEIPTEANQKEQSYYMQFSELIGVLKKFTEDRGLKDYYLQTALRKMKAKTVSKKLRRTNNQPRYVYEFKCINDKITSLIHEYIS